MVMLKDLVVVCVGDEESLTCTVKDDVPAAVGVPEIWPEEALRVSPAGKEPELIDQEYGDVPPEAASEAAYAELTCPEVSEVVVIEMDVTAAAIVTENDLVAVCGVGLES
jgi:hypothetical protein